MAIMETLKEVVGLVQKLDNVDLIQKLLQLQQDAIIIVQQNHALLDEKRALAEEAQSLKSQLALRASVTRKDGMYFAEGDPEPFCPQCWEVNRALVHLQRREGRLDFGARRFFCGNCGRGIGPLV